MMYAKLALRNVRRTARDYLIYVVTLVLSVGMFYGFFSLVSPYYNATLPVPIHLDVLKKMMRIAVPLVGLFVVFLMSYVNSYMLRRKQKEFAIETIIGMEQKTVAFLFFLETSVMGATVIFFGAIVLLLGIKNLFAVRKLKIIQMLQNSQKGVENIPLTRQVGKWVVVCTAVSTVILGMMAALSCLVLHYPAALFRVLFLTFLAAGFLVSAVFFFLAGRKKRDGSGPLMALTIFGAAEGIALLVLSPLFDSLVRQRIAIQAYLTMPPVFALLLLVFSLIAFFSNLTWWLSKMIRKPSVLAWANQE